MAVALFTTMVESLFQHWMKGDCYSACAKTGTTLTNNTYTSKPIIGPRIPKLTTQNQKGPSTWPGLLRNWILSKFRSRLTQPHLGWGLDSCGFGQDLKWSEKPRIKAWLKSGRSIWCYCWKDRRIASNGVKYDRSKLLDGLNISDLNDMITLAFAGKTVGNVSRVKSALIWLFV
jgi:hypothetical protein